MLSRSVIFACFFGSLTIIHVSKAAETVYDCYTSEPASDELLEEYNYIGNKYICTVEVEECNETDYSRLDGSCNNLESPAVGTFNTPNYMMVPPVFGDNYTVRTAQDGEALPGERKCRTEILGSGESSHPYLNMLFGHLLKSFFGDFMSMHDERNMLHNTTTCCTAEGQNNDICAPMTVPEDDPVHKFSGLRCMNMTKPLTLQYYGCAAQNTTPARIGNYTHFMDLSFLYYPSPTAMQQARAYEGGLLLTEEEDGAIWPPQASNTDNCKANVLPDETRCSAITSNADVGSNLVSIWLYRMHNFVATNLATVNPSWSDEKNFQTTRQIMIAMWCQIVFHELLPLILGRQNMVNANIISYDTGFRDIYNASISPKISADFVYSGKWFDTIQQGTVRMYDDDGNYVKEIPITNLTQRTGYLAVDNNIAMITRGAILDPCADADDIVDSIIGDNAFGSLQWATDMLASDLARGRLYGIAPYVKYRDFCNTSQTHTSYDHIAHLIRPTRLPLIKSLYPNASDVDLLAALWAEKNIPNGECPYTVSCIMLEQLSRIVKSDRHWYERADRPYAFTSDQLAAVRNASVAYVLCQVGDNITQIQPQALRMPIVGNEVVNCSTITSMNFTVWADDTSNTTTTTVSNDTAASNDTTTE